MVTYPVSVHRDYYRGADARKKQKARDHNRYATQIEEASNRLIQSQREAIRTYLWPEISRESGVPLEIVEKLGYSIDGGSNGFTATRPGLSESDYQRALDGHDV